MTNIRLPNITAATEREQLLQVKSYLHQLVQELNWALSTIESGNGTANTGANKLATGNTVTQEELKTSYNELRSLILKSAGTVSAYSEAAEERYNSLYVAQSDFGTYTEEASQQIQENSTAIESFYEDMQVILTDIENLVLEHSRIDVSANIKSGVLDYDDSGIPVYGLEIGQRTKLDGEEVFDKFARFTSDSLTFYDQNDNEVAYISDRKLYITHVEVKGTFSMGGFIDTKLSDGSIVTKWVGTGG
jgi:hypothetical protein